MAAPQKKSFVNGKALGTKSYARSRLRAGVLKACKMVMEKAHLELDEVVGVLEIAKRDLLLFSEMNRLEKRILALEKRIETLKQSTEMTDTSEVFKVEDEWRAKSAVS